MMDPPPVQAPALVERRRRRCTLPMCVLSISLVESVFYCLVITVFSLGLIFVRELPKLHQDEAVADILRYIVVGFAGIYFLLSLVLLLGVLKKVRSLLVFWIIGTLSTMTLEWICVVISVAFLLNGSLFFISGSYGPIRLCFVCLTGLYAQRLKIKENATAVPLVRANSNGDGYSMVHNAIFTQPLSEDMEEDESVRVTFELSGDDQSLI